MTKGHRGEPVGQLTGDNDTTRRWIAQVLERSCRLTSLHPSARDQFDGFAGNARTAALGRMLA